MKLSNYKTSLLLLLTISSVALAACQTTPAPTPAPAPAPAPAPVNAKCTQLTTEIDGLKKTAQAACKTSKTDTACISDVSAVNAKIKEYNNDKCTPTLTEVTAEEMSK